MSLIARIATSVSAYAVSSSSFAPGAWARACSSSSMPVISGMRWSDSDERDRPVAQRQLGEDGRAPPRPELARTMR